MLSCVCLCVSEWEIGKLRLNLRIEPRMNLRRSTMYEKAAFLAKTGIRKNSAVACGSSLIKINYFDYTKRFINRISEVMI